MSGEDAHLKALLDESQAVDGVSLNDLRWLYLFKHTELKAELRNSVKSLQRELSSLQGTHNATLKLVGDNTRAVAKAQQAHDDCPLSNEEGREKFANGAVKNAVKEAVQEANGTKPVVGPLSRGEVFQVMSWVIFALAAALVLVATNGAIQLPLP